MAAIPASLLQMFRPLEVLLTDPAVRRIVVEGPNGVLVERHGRLETTPLVYATAELEEGLAGLARRAGKPFDEAHPSLEAQLKDGTRFLALRAPVVEGPPTLVVIRPGGRATDLEVLCRQEALTLEAANALKAAMGAGLNIAVAGPPDSGRTALMEALTGSLPMTARIVVVEDHAELRLFDRNVVRLSQRKPDKDGQGGVTMGDLLDFAGRMAIDRVVLGDVRWQDACESVHMLAGRGAPVLLALLGLDAEDALSRLEALSRATATGGRERAVGGLLAAGLDVVLTMGRIRGQRVVLKIEEVRASAGTWSLSPLFTRTDRERVSLSLAPGGAERLSAWASSARPGLFGESASARETGDDLETPGPKPARPLEAKPSRPLEAKPGLTSPRPGSATALAAPAPSIVTTQDLGGASFLQRGDGADPLRRLVQGLRDEPPEAGYSSRPTIADFPGLGAAGSDARSDDQESTLVSEAISLTTQRDDPDGRRSAKTFSEVIRNVGTPVTGSIDSGMREWDGPASKTLTKQPTSDDEADTALRDRPTKVSEEG